MSVGSALRFLGLGSRQPKEHEELAASRPANGGAARDAAVRESSMTDTTKAGDSAADKDKEQKPVDQAAEDKPADKPADKPVDPPKDEAAAEASRIKAIVELCTLVGNPGAALGFINSKASVDDVRAKLAKAKADAVDRNQVDGTVPASGASADHGWGAAVDKVNAEAGLKPRH